MNPLTVEKLASLIDGTPHRIDLHTEVETCVIDSRHVQSGDAFFALAGEHQHGLQFAQAAIKMGAVVVVVDESMAEGCTVPHIAVADAEYALAQIANHNRNVSDALVIGVTGSVGKTTTRRLIASVLKTQHAGIQSPRNFNNQLGVPLSLMELEDGDEFAVIEIGASEPQEIGFLASVARPEMAVITRITPTHLRGLDSLQTIQREKGELVRCLPADGTAFLNADDPLVAELAESTKAQVVTFGTSETADVRATHVRTTKTGLRLIVNGEDYDAPVRGRQQVCNVLAAIAVGLEIGVDPEGIRTGLMEFQAAPGRSEVVQSSPYTLIDDTYNSSPASVSAALQLVADWSDCHHRILILNDMLDLGQQAADLHYGIGSAIAASNIDHVLLCGDFADDVADGFLQSGGRLNRVSVFSDLNTLEALLDCFISDDDVVLVKGSRATRMERVVERLQSADSSALSKAA